LRKFHRLRFIDFAFQEKTILSHKITNIVTKQHIVGLAKINDLQTTFLNLLTAKLRILNSDQSSINYEMCTNTPLSNAGENLTLATISSHHVLSHSYTVQHTMSMDGKLHSPFLICL
jgi:hypothetical protein